MKIELSNGETQFWQWDRNQKVKPPDGVETVHFKIDSQNAVEVAVTDGWAAVPDECFQSGNDLILWSYKTDHTLDEARVRVKSRRKPIDYIYTPTEIKKWESLDERIAALEKGGVKSVNGKTGDVEITAEGLGALTESDLQEATDKALEQAKASGEFDGAQGPKGDTGAQGPQGETGPQGPAGPQGSAGATPVKGTDYWTAEDKASIIQDTLAALPAWTGGSY